MARTSLIFLALAWLSQLAIAGGYTSRGPFDPVVIFTNIENDSDTGTVPDLPNLTFQRTTTTGNPFRLRLASEGGHWVLDASLSEGFNCVIKGQGLDRGTFATILRSGTTAPFTSGTNMVISSVRQSFHTDVSNDGRVGLTYRTAGTTQNPGYASAAVYDSGTFTEVYNSNMGFPGFPSLSVYRLTDFNFVESDSSFALGFVPVTPNTSSTHARLLQIGGHTIAAGPGATNGFVPELAQATAPTPLPGEDPQFLISCGNLRVSDNGVNSAYGAGLPGTTTVGSQIGVLVFNGAIVLRAGATVPGIPPQFPVSGLGNIEVSDAGYIYRFSDTSGKMNVSTEDGIVARSGNPIGLRYPGVLWTNGINGVAINNFGEYAISSGDAITGGHGLLVSHASTNRIELNRNDYIDVDDDGYLNDQDYRAGQIASDSLSIDSNLNATYVVHLMSGTSNNYVGYALVKQKLQLPGDVDRSTEVDAADIDLVIANFGGDDQNFDVDGSGEVDAADIDIVIANFGRSN